jgi:hypothetical protein
MNRSRLISIIAIVLIGFILFKGAVGMICQPEQKNSVADVVSNVITNVAPAPSLNPISEKPDPLSWGPILNNLVKLIAKACPA